MKLVARCAITVAFVIALAAPTIARKKSGAHNSPRPSKSRPDQIEAAARLQIFLDRANFSPGAITGRYNAFTFKALSLYRQSRGEPTPAQAAKVPQKTVKYQDTPKGEQRCDNCALFEAPASCKTVDGTIAAQGWSIVYAKKPT